ncbi:hypothetical protein AK812_SmicGene45402, partial [Symbiodinium microadriaticum]
MASPDSAKRTVNCHCLAGSSFELDVNCDPAALLVLTCGGCIIDQRQLLLHQVQCGEIWYVVRKLGACRDAMLWECLLEEKTLCDALNETMSPTWFSNEKLNQGIQPTTQQPAEFDVWLTFGREFNQSLEGMQLPSSLQRLTFGREFNQSLEGMLTFGREFNRAWMACNYPAACRVCDLAA